ncbi:hypothetical protein DVH24_008520 [Malus domestica]|uniref:Uncharacterized protein n=1 Tax=Malus domestica TaxID=3750 RepID=A0A498JKC7_MALDO|nr:hypothetical protein DVH24_008520 [Malus domestica]
MPAYGGMKSIYTAGPLSVASKDSVVKLAEKDAQASSSSATVPPPSPLKAVAYPTRLGYGKFGDVRANQLIVEVAAARDQQPYGGGPFSFFKPTTCKPESLMAFLDPHWRGQSLSSAPKNSDEGSLDFFSKNRRTLSVISSNESSDVSVKLGRLSVGAR